MTVSIPSKKQIAHSFSLKASSYEANATVQNKLLSLLHPRVLQSISSMQGNWADLGCGTGFLEKKIPSKVICHLSNFFCVDLALKSLHCLHVQTKNIFRPIQSDIELLPFKQNSFNGIVISSVLQWFSDPQTVLEQIATILKEEGIIIFSAFIEKSFRELLQTRHTLGLTIPVLLPEKDLLFDIFKSSGLHIKEWEHFSMTEYFSDAHQALKSFSRLGTTAVGGNRLTKGRLSELCVLYDKNYKTVNGTPVTYNAVIGTAIKRKT